MPKPMQMPTLEISKDSLNWFNKYLVTAAQKGIVTERVTITPERAAVLLSRNPDNRNIREAKVAQLSTDLTAGKFRFNGESVIISKDGLLNDGQHRLFACIKTGVSFDTVLVVGTERESRYSIDTGSAKSAGDHLSFQGVHNANTAAAVARYILTWEREGNFTRRGRVSAQQQIERVQTDALLREISAWVDNKRARMRNIIKGALSGFIFYLFAEKSPVEAKLFMDQLAIGAGLDANSPIFLLREKLRQKEKMSDSQVTEACVRAWNHWCQGPTTTISRLQLMGTIPEIMSPQWHVSDSNAKHHLPQPAQDDMMVVGQKTKQTKQSKKKQEA